MLPSWFRNNAAGCSHLASWRPFGPRPARLPGISDALNHAYDVEEGRPFWKVRGMAILLTIGLSIFLIASIVLLMFGPQIGSWIADLRRIGKSLRDRLEYFTLARHLNSG